PASSGNAPSDEVVIFNGRDLTGFRDIQFTSRVWTVEDGTLKATAKGVPLKTEREFSDFDLTFRIKYPENVEESSCPMFFFRDGQSAERSGVIFYADRIKSYQQAGRDHKTVPPRKNDFNDVSVRSVGKHTRIVVNGEVLADAEFATQPTGVLSWQQGNAAGVWIKDIRLTVPTTAAPPLGDYALRFDGNSIVDLGNLSKTNYPSEKGDITLEAYVTPDDLKVGSRIVGSSLRAALKIDPPGPNAEWKFSHSAQGKFPRSPVTPNRRVHVAGVRRNNENFLFVDGKLVSHIPDAPLTDKINQPWSIGSQLVGVIDEVRISNTARYSQDFIPAARFETDDKTTALYHFDEGTGDVLRDDSGNGADGKIVGATWVKADGTPVDSQPSANGKYALMPTTDGGVLMDSLDFNLAEPFTLEGYISPATYLGANSICLAMGNGFAGLCSGPRGITFSIKHESKQYSTARSSHIPVAGTLVHVAGVWTTEEAHLYVNGTLEETVNLAGEKPLLGKSKFSLGTQFNGLVSELRVSKGIRYRGQQFTPEKRFEPDANTLALYHFDEGTGDVLKDSSGNNHHGKIVGAKWVRVDGSAIASPDVVATPTKIPAGNNGSATTPVRWNTPEFQAWLADTQKLSAEKQLEAVSKKLMELNPGFKGVLTGLGSIGRPKILNGAVTELGFSVVHVTDISPVRALTGLQALSCSGDEAFGILSDLSPLRGMGLSVLHLHKTAVSDLSPLIGMSLTQLNCGFTTVTDLSPLTGMPLTSFDCHVTKVSDLSPLKDAPLTHITFSGTRVTDMSPLRGKKLTRFD
ncbi:MAG: DUF1080 domain-containing protein, partial [Planctomycetaceae bacterium]|nr:DUF1080 domain-containing protein [Planctomycetaceae bacterium]